MSAGMQAGVVERGSSRGVQSSTCALVAIAVTLVAHHGGAEQERPDKLPVELQAPDDSTPQASPIQLRIEPSTGQTICGIPVVFRVTLRNASGKHQMLASPKLWREGYQLEASKDGGAFRGINVWMREHGDSFRGGPHYSFDDPYLLPQWVPPAPALLRTDITVFDEPGTYRVKAVITDKIAGQIVSNVRELTVVPLPEQSGFAAVLRGLLPDTDPGEALKRIGLSCAQSHYSRSGIGTAHGNLLGYAQAAARASPEVTPSDFTRFLRYACVLVPPRRTHPRLSVPIIPPEEWSAEDMIPHPWLASRLYARLFRLRFDQKRYEEAVSAFEKGQQFPEAWSHYETENGLVQDAMLAYEKLGRASDAVKWARWTIQHYPYPRNRYPIVDHARRILRELTNDEEGGPDVRPAVLSVEAQPVEETIHPGETPRVRFSVKNTSDRVQRLFLSDSACGLFTLQAEMRRKGTERWQVAISRHSYGEPIQEADFHDLQPGQAYDGVLSLMLQGVHRLVPNQVEWYGTYEVLFAYRMSEIDAERLGLGRGCSVTAAEASPMEFRILPEDMPTVADLLQRLDGGDLDAVRTVYYADLRDAIPVIDRFLSGQTEFPADNAQRARYQCLDYLATVDFEVASPILAKVATDSRFCFQLRERAFQSLSSFPGDKAGPLAVRFIARHPEDALVVLGSLWLVVKTGHRRNDVKDISLLRRAAERATEKSTVKKNTDRREYDQTVRFSVDVCEALGVEQTREVLELIRGRLPNMFYSNFRELVQSKLSALLKP